uniref:SXP/RAL-2 family protein 2 isoform 2 n=1 Tax=Anisakis simplex TaxID=6269 RepID=A7M6S9_ANISI|nr:SXP/RAL-2 family protein 2 isoform 2 [Anisakis simplex]
MRVLFFVAAVVAVSLAQDQGPPPLPKFLDGADQATKDAFAALAQTFKDDTDKQVEDAVQQFVNDHPAIKDAYEAEKKEVLAAQQAAEEEHKKLVAALPPDAQKADAELTAIADDASLTLAAKHDKIVQTFESLPPAVKEELNKLNQQGQS